MKCRTIERGAGTASVLVTPSWLGRLFGARPYVLRCERSCFGEWRTVASRRSLSLPILDAIDRDEVTELPAARTEP